MPGWTVTTWEAGVDWTAIAVVQEFVDALNQRSLAIGGETLLADILLSKASTCTVVGTTLTAEDSIFTAAYVGHTVDIRDIGTRTIAAYTSGTEVTLSADATCEDKGFILNGTDIQAASFWATFQDFITDRWSNFVKSHDAGVKRDRDWFGDSTQNETYDPGTLFRYQSLADLFDAAGLGTDTFRRYTTHPDDAGADLEGTIAAGDILGHWVWEDLMKLFNAMVWTPGVVAWSSGGINNEMYGDSGGQASWALAIGGAHADWNHESENDEARPGAATAGTFVGGAYTGRVTRTISLAKTTAYDGLARDVTWYVRCMAVAGDRWSAQDDPDILEGKWSDWLEDAPATDDTDIVSSAYLGAALTEPGHWYAAPWGPWEYYGWVVADEYAVVHWDRSGGFSSY